MLGVLASLLLLVVLGQEALLYDPLLKRTPMAFPAVIIVIVALMGLIMATGSCPWFQQLRTLADTHLPFASIEDTLLRVAGTYLIQEYFVARQHAVRTRDCWVFKIEFRPHVFDTFMQDIEPVLLW